MTLLFSADDVASLATPSVALDAMREGFTVEAQGRTNLPTRLDSDSPTGFIRCMPAVLGDVMGLKIMTLVEGLGTRYLVLLYSVETGELLALVDADELTKIRTAATTLLAGERMLEEPPSVLTIIGTGFEAQGHLELFMDHWPIEVVHVYSRREANRREFASLIGERFEMEGVPCATSREALQASTTVLLATKSKTPVIDGDDLLPGSVVLSIGSTRPDLRELDVRSLERAATLVVDAKDQVLSESGDIIAAVEAGALSNDAIVPLGDLCLERRVLPRAEGERDVTAFKSVGTALQDLALARAIYDLALKNGLGRDIGEVTRLKPFK